MYQLGQEREINISGIALIENTGQQSSFLVIHDNKKKKQKRAGIIKISSGVSQYSTIEWIDKKPPVDLEALTEIPGKPRSFMAMTSAGKIYHIELDQNNSSVKVINSNVRHISEVKVKPNGSIYISDAVDPGNDGPFS